MSSTFQRSSLSSRKQSKSPLPAITQLSASATVLMLDSTAYFVRRSITKPNFAVAFTSRKLWKYIQGNIISRFVMKRFKLQLPLKKFQLFEDSVFGSEICCASEDHAYAVAQSGNRGQV